MLICFDDVSKVYVYGVIVVDWLMLEVFNGMLIVFVGFFGCGKMMVL